MHIREWTSRMLLGRFQTISIRTTVRKCSSTFAKLTPEQRTLVDKLIRVDHAGELGAGKIYAGQLAVLGNTESAPLLKHMAEQEKEHLDAFERLIPKYRVRPSAFLPIWNVAGYLLGAGSALLGKEAAMACTVAVEETIGQHYNDQLRELMADDPESHKELIQIISKCRDEELEHFEIGLENNAEQAPLYGYLKTAVQFGCKCSIWISEKV